MTKSFVEPFEQHGVRADRIELRDWTPNLNHLAEYYGIDIALDKFPCSGTTTTREALWMTFQCSL